MTKTLLPFLLLISCGAFCQMDSARPLDSIFFSKYSRWALSFGPSVGSGNFNDLRKVGPMLHKPYNVFLLPINAGIYYGRTNRYFLELEGAVGSYKHRGEYESAGKLYDQMLVEILHVRYSVYMYKNIYYSTKSMLALACGPSFATTNIKSSAPQPSGDGRTGFIDGSISQYGLLYLGAMFRHLISDNEADKGWMIKVGYNIPVLPANYYLGGPGLPNPEWISLGGFTASASVFLWTYKTSYKKALLNGKK